MGYKHINRKNLQSGLDKLFKTSKEAAAGPGFEDKVWKKLGEQNPSFSAGLFSRWALPAWGAAAAIIIMIAVAVLNTGNRRGQDGVVAGDKGKAAIKQEALAAISTPALINTVINRTEKEKDASKPGTPVKRDIIMAPDLTAGLQQAIPLQGGTKYAAGPVKDAAASEFKVKAAGITKEPTRDDTGITGNLEVKNNVISPLKGETAVVKYRISTGCDVAVIIYDRNGRVIRNIFKGSRGPGIYTEYWKGDSDSGKIVNAGIYIMRVKTDLVDEKIKIGIVK